MNAGVGIIPPGGFRFAQRLPNGSFHLFFGTSYEDLAKKVTEFRAGAGLPPGDPMQEVKNPISAATHIVHNPQLSLRERVTAWLVNKQFGVLRYVPQEEANRRALLAIKCPYNTTDYADECIECYNSTLRGLFAIRQGRSTPYDDQLGACRHCGWDNRTVVHLQASSLNIVASHKPCWCATLAQEQAKELE